jgi:hypothetical protein
MAVLLCKHSGGWTQQVPWRGDLNFRNWANAKIKNFTNFESKDARFVVLE